MAARGACGGRSRSRGARRPSWTRPSADTRLDGVLERHVGERVVLLRLEGELAARSRDSLRSFRSLYFESCPQRMHFMRAPPGGRPRPSTKTRSQASSIASVQSRSPTRRRRVSFGSSWPCRRRATYSARNRPRRASAAGPSRSSISRPSGPSTQSVIGTLMPNLRRQTISRGRCFCRASFRTYFSQAPRSFSCGGRRERRLGQGPVEQRHAHVERPGVGHPLGARQDVLRALQRDVGQAHAVEERRGLARRQVGLQQRAALARAARPARGTRACTARLRARRSGGTSCR